MGFKKIVAIILFQAAAFAGSLHETVIAQPGFDFFYNLQYDEALAVFLAEAERNPSSADNFNHIAQTVLWKEMYRAGMLSSEFIGGTQFVHYPKLVLTEEQQKQFNDALNRAMSLSQEKLAADPNEGGALYSIGVSYGLRANYSFVVKKAWRDALKDATAARKAHVRLTELDPAFVDAELTQGMNDYIVGSLPFQWKMLGFLAGFHGDKQRGIRTLKEVSERGRMNRVDAMALLAALYLREHRPEEAIPVLKELTQEFPKNPVLRVELEKATAGAR
jgi:tetratricopeptide (TPR) repeat protein